MWSQRLVVGMALALVVVIVVTGLHYSGHKAALPPKSTTPPKSSTPPETNVGVRHCAAGDMTVAIELRRPSHRQDSGDLGGFEAHSHQRVATIVLRNVSDHRCLGGSPFDFTILDRLGRPVGEYLDHGEWFIDYYQPGGQRTFSLPAVYRCDRPGPFTAVAAVGGYTARRHGLFRSAITCS